MHSGQAGAPAAAACARMPGMSSRAHAFSVEALVGKSSKRMKVEVKEEEKIQVVTSTERDLDGHGQAEEHGCESESAVKVTEESSDDQQVRVDLQGSDLWKRFHEIGTEMIITKAGRRMFPSIRVKVRNLDPVRQYHIAMDITPVDSKRYRYVYHSSQWMVAGNTDHSCITPRLYVHPDSPCSGETWMRQVISFDRVKLTNNEMDDKGHIILQSMHKYKPRVHVIEREAGSDLVQLSSLPQQGVHTFTFPETQFTTVTAYQNQQITKLKIDRNPFAKGFRDPGRNRGVLDGILESYPWRSPFSLDLKPFTLELPGGSPGSSASCGPLSPLKSLLPQSSPPASHPFTLSGPEPLHSLSVPLCYKVTPQNHPFSSRTYCSLGPERLRAYPGFRPLSDFPLLSPLQGKKAVSCRGQCLQAPAALGPCLLSIQSLQAARASGAQQLQPYGLYSYSFPISPHFSTITGASKPAHNVSLTPPENLLHHTAWNSSINHCL